jgi:hypothetical protein
LAPLLVALLTLALVSSASANTQRPFKEAFGSAAQPSFGEASTITVEQRTGDVLVSDESTQSITRYHADGTPAPFPALGTNVIDGKESGGKPCAEEPASCDKTPQDGIQTGNQIAIDESGGPADGDIYLSQFGSGLVDIFASDGHYLGQLTKTGLREFRGAISGVAVDSTGVVYVSDEYVLDKFVPQANPATNDDFTESIAVNNNGVLESGVRHGVVAGSGPSAGSMFLTVQNFNEKEGRTERVLQVNDETGQIESKFGEGVIGPAAVDPITHNVLTDSGAEYEVSGGSKPVRVGRVVPKHRIEAVAINGSSEAILAEFSEPTLGVYGTPAVVPTVTAEPAGEVTGTKATLTGTVNPTGLPVTKCAFRYSGPGASGEAPCEGSIPTDSNPHPVHVSIEGLKPNGVSYSFHIIAYNENGYEESEFLSFKTATTVVTEPATGIGLTTATLNGLVRPEGHAYSECFFEYGLTTNTSFEGKAPCSPSAAAILADFNPHEVKAAITGLQSGRAYRYRLVATSTDGTVGTLKGEEQVFGTLGLPRISEVQASGADQGSVTLEARINPSGFGTSYRFEYGPTTAYGSLAPAEFEPFIGSGTEPVLVKAKVSGLAVGSTYHYRVIASSGRGTTLSPDHTAETLNSCGLPEGRCFELVSRPEAGPVAVPGEASSGREMHYQAATGGPGSLAYPVESGYPESTKGAEVVYRSVRGTGSWASTQLSAPIAALNETKGPNSVSGQIRFLSNDLSCGFTESGQPLTADPGMKFIREEGGGNLYRINPDNSYTGVTKLPPTNTKNLEVIGIDNYSVAGASQDCSVVLFSTQFTYPGIPTELNNGNSTLYEWRAGSLRNAGIVPGPGGEEVVVAASAGGEGFFGHSTEYNSVSEDGSRVFFSARRQASSNPEEIGKTAIFVREDGTETHDVSLSETSVPDEGAAYQWATADGSKVFFTANAGLTAKSNSTGTDLYEYDLETEELTDRSVTPIEGGAQVGGLLGASADSSQVYFASQNQLIPGSGSSRAQNVSAETYSIYGEKAGTISFVGTLTERDLLSFGAAGTGGGWTSQVSPDGRYLLFESSAKVTGYESDGLGEAYLYDAESGETTCISCRQDGQPSSDERYGTPLYQTLFRQFFVNPLHAPRFLTMHDGEPQVFFSSPDPLAPGAVAGQNNIYEWSHDQVFRLVSAAAGTQVNPSSGFTAIFAGASEDGSDVYLTTPETLNWEDGDKRLSVYDARVGGGFPEPPPAPVPCDVTVEGACQAPAQSVPATPGAASATFNGPGNPQQKSSKKKSKKKPHKKKHKHAKKKGNGKQARSTNGNRRAGK